MIGSANISKIVEEGRKAKEIGKREWDNPYCFITETLAAYAWDQGFKGK